MRVGEDTDSTAQGEDIADGITVAAGVAQGWEGTRRL